MGAAMRYSALEILLGILSLQVVCSQHEWSVTHRRSRICAVKGSTVDMECTYAYPSNRNSKTTVTKKFWFIKPHYPDSDLVDLSTNPHYAGRVEYNFDGSRCTLTISNLRESDSAVYNFRFITNQTRGSYSGKTGVTLTVTDLQVIPYGLQVNCASKCPYSRHTSYIWYINGIRNTWNQKYHLYHTSNADSFSCAVKGNQQHPSPSVCMKGESCNWVKYRENPICAPKGSSVDISCTYNSFHGPATSGLWFTTDPSRQWYYQEDEDPTKSNLRVNVQMKRGNSTLRIINVTETDSVQYRFRFFSTNFQWGRDFPGTNLTVTDLKVEVTKVDNTSTEADLLCRTSCSPPSLFSYAWFLNGRKLQTDKTSSYKGWLFTPGDNICCALQEYPQYRSPPVYALEAPTVSWSPGNIMEGTPVTLTCTTTPTQAVVYAWHKKGGDYEAQILHNEQQLVFHSIKLSDSGEYYCTAENELGKRKSEPRFIDVNYPPKSASLTASIHGDIVEGSSVTLNCSSDAKPAANYTWYNGKHTRLPWWYGSYRFDFISHHDSGTYYCNTANQFGTLSMSIHLNVLYAPKLLNVSVSPSSEVTVGSVVHMNCSSSANPVANYTWYKENDDSPRAWGPSFIITDIRSEHSGKYYCEAWNSRGHNNATIHLLVMADSMKAGLAGSITVLLVCIPLLVAFLYIRRKRSAKPPPTPGERQNPTTQPRADARYAAASAQGPVTEQQEDICYSTVAFSKKTQDPIYSNVSSAQLNRLSNEEEEEEYDVDYSFIVCKGDSKPAGSKYEEAVDSCALYSTVSKNPRA